MVFDRIGIVRFVIKMCFQQYPYTRFFIINVFYFILGPPTAPAGCDVHNRTQKSSIVSCTRIRFGGGDQSEKQYFHMEVKDQQSRELLQNQTSSTPIFTIRYFFKATKT